MKRIMPFRAVVFNQEKIGDISQVVCPPYDVITPVKRKHYHKINPHNFIRILLGNNVAGEDKYKRSAKHFKEWLHSGVFVQDQLPCIYFYLQRFNIRGQKRSRMGFIALLRLDQSESRVFGHEHTRSEPKVDRLRILRKVKANLSPIFAIFPDKHRIIRRVYDHYIKGKEPFIDITDSDNVLHQLWRIDSPEVTEQIQKKMDGENIFIADGHHRYEVACIYREQMKKKLQNLTGREAFNFIPAYFTNPQTPDLTIMPVHRLIFTKKGFDFAIFRKDLEEVFEVEEVKDKIKFFFMLEKAGSTENVLGMYADGRFYLLRLKNVLILDRLIADKPKAYRFLSVSIFNYLVLKKILGMDIEDKKRILFNPDASELIEQARGSRRAMVFILNPVKMTQIMSVAIEGERMPSKSTYFYPKVLSGLVINKF